MIKIWTLLDERNILELFRVKMPLFGKMQEGSYLSDEPFQLYIGVRFEDCII